MGVPETIVFIILAMLCIFLGCIWLHRVMEGDEHRYRLPAPLPAPPARPRGLKMETLETIIFIIVCGLLIGVGVEIVFKYEWLWRANQ